MVAPVVEGAVHYSPLPYLVILRMLDHLHLSGDEVLVDVGSGKGRVLCVACRRRLQRVVGVEVNHELSKVARRNLRRVRGKRTTVELVEALAQEYTYRDVDVIVMYNPFDGATMEQVFGQVDISYRERRRRIKVAYANCVHEEPLKRLGWLRRTDEWPPFSVAEFPHRISFWESDDAAMARRLDSGEESRPNGRLLGSDVTRKA